MPAGESAISWLNAVLPERPAAWWSPERLRLLNEYMRLARAARREGRHEEAAGVWEEALGRLPDMPEPRRAELRRLISEALKQAAREALRQLEPDVEAAIGHLERSARSAGDPSVYPILGFLLHKVGRPAAALEWYARAEEETKDAFSRALEYARTLARLQLMIDPGNVPGEKALSGADREGPSPGEPLELGSWQRLWALNALRQGNISRAHRRFPGPDWPEMPAAWALEGALIAALARNWPACLAYYQRALAAAPRLSTPHRCVMASAVVNTVDPSATFRDRFSWLPDDLAEELGNRAPKRLFADERQYKRWRRQVLEWQYRRRLMEARSALAREDDAGIRRALAAAVQLLPDVPLSRRLAVWMACAYGTGQPGRRVLQEARGAGSEQAEVLRLCVWAAERFGRTKDVIGELNRLLERHPDDGWGLDRWKRWMVRLGRNALEKGRYRQALLQFVSLLLRLPEDPDGWSGCGRVHAATGEAARAADCFAQARRLKMLRASPVSAVMPQGEREKYGLLRPLLEESLLPSPAPDPCPFAKEVLLQAVWASARAGDAYLEMIIDQWVRGRSSAASAG